MDKREGGLVSLGDGYAGAASLFCQKPHQSTLMDQRSSELRSHDLLYSKVPFEDWETCCGSACRKSIASYKRTTSALATFLHVPNPAAGMGTAQSPTASLVTSEPTAVISPTPSLPPTAGRSGNTPYEPSTCRRVKGWRRAFIAQLLLLSLCLRSYQTTICHHRHLSGSMMASTCPVRCARQRSAQWALQ